jgi:XTP/dITP diphosphohydrolase
VATLIIDGSTFSFEGIVKGTIALEKAGTNGFGYDPIFIPQGFEKSLANFSMEEKNSISHRKKALKAWLTAIN